MIEIINKATGTKISYDGENLDGTASAVWRAHNAVNKGQKISMGDPYEPEVEASFHDSPAALLALLRYAVAPDAPFAGFVAVTIDGKPIGQPVTDTTMQSAVGKKKNLKKNQLSPDFKVLFPEHPTYSLLRTKAGVIGRPIKETHGDVMDQVAARSGVIRVSNGFRCPDNMTNGGTFTDAMGSTCGVRVIAGALEQIQDVIAAAVPESDNPVSSAVSKIMDRSDSGSSVSRTTQSVASLSELLAGPGGRPSRVRLTLDELMPEAFDTDLSGQAVDIIKNRRPEGIYSGLTRNLGPDSSVISPEDIESDRYLRSLGGAILTEARDPNTEIGKQIFELEQARTERRRLLESGEELGQVLVEEIIAEELSKIEKLLSEFVFEPKGVRLGTQYGLVRKGKIVTSTLSPVEESGMEGFATYIFYAKDSTGADILIEVRIPITGKAKSNASFMDGGPDIKFFIGSDEFSNEKAGLFTGKKKKFAIALDEFFRAQNLEENDPVHPLSGLVLAENRISNEVMPLMIESITSSESAADEQALVQQAILQVMESHGYKRGKGIDRDELRIISGDDPKLLEWARSPVGDRGFLMTDILDYREEQIYEALNTALQLFPEAFQEKIRKRGLLLFRDPQALDRAYANFLDSENLDTSPGMINIDSFMLDNQDHMVSVLMHELMHINQFFNPEIVEAEYVTFAARTGGKEKASKLRDLIPGSKYAKDEVAIPDDVDMFYMFKIYEAWGESQRPNSIMEITPVLTEMIFGRGSSKFGGDMDMASFLIGLLMDLGS